MPCNRYSDSKVHVPRTVHIWEKVEHQKLVLVGFISTEIIMNVLIKTDKIKFWYPTFLGGGIKTEYIDIYKYKHIACSGNMSLYSICDYYRACMLIR